MPVTDSGAIGQGDHLGTPNRAGLEARAEGVQAFAASCVAGGARMECFVVSMVVHWSIWVVCETSRAQHPCIVGDPGTRPLRRRSVIAKPLGTETQHQRSPEGMEKRWCEVGARN